MSNTGTRVRSITTDPAIGESERISDQRDGNTSDPSSRRGSPPSGEDGSEGLDEFILPTSGPSREAILDAERRDVTSEVNGVIRKLQELQLRCGLQKRFHLVIEKDVDDSVLKWAEEGSSSISSCSPVECRILFSPTLRYDSPDTRMLTKSMTAHLNAASFAAMRKAVRRGNQPSITNNPGTSSAQPDSRITVAESPTSLDITNMEGWDTFRVPEWFPFSGDMYKTGPQVSKNELLEVPGSTANKFLRLSKDSLEKIWSQFFRSLHDGVRRKEKKFSRLSFKYTLYTPPWLRKQIRVGTQLHHIGAVTIRPVRNQRSDWGYRTMALILGAFFHKECWFGEPILKHLLNNLFKGMLGRNRRLSTTVPSNARPRKVRLNGQGQPTSLTPNENINVTERPSVAVNADEESRNQENNINHQSEAEAPFSVEATPTESRGEEPRRQNGDVQPDAEARQVADNDDTGNNTQSPGKYGVHDVLCAAGSSCRFREDPEAQKLEGFTAKCKICQRPVHDLCGGGENEAKCCPHCNRTD